MHQKSVPHRRIMVPSGRLCRFLGTLSAGITRENVSKNGLPTSEELAEAPEGQKPSNNASQRIADRASAHETTKGETANGSHETTETDPLVTPLEQLGLPSREDFAPLCCPT